MASNGILQQSFVSC